MATNGNDFIQGTNAGDLVNALRGNDTVLGLQGNDTLNGNENNDSLRGGQGDDNLGGGKGNDIVNGELGFDTLSGGQGFDTLIGGTSSADFFRFNSANEGTDVLTDFQWQQGDKIQISASGFGGGLTAGSLSFDQFTTGSSANDSSDRFIYDGFNALYFDPDGTGLAGQVQIASFNNPSLNETDFQIF